MSGCLTEHPLGKEGFFLFLAYPRMSGHNTLPHPTCLAVKVFLHRKGLQDLPRPGVY